MSTTIADWLIENVALLLSLGLAAIGFLIREQLAARRIERSARQLVEARRANFRVALARLKTFQQESLDREGGVVQFPFRFIPEVNSDISEMFQVLYVRGHRSAVDIFRDKLEIYGL